MALDEQTKQRVWQAIAAIPYGKVASYGQIAAIADIPRHARAVGKILSQLPKDSKLPWYRVINSQGRISFPLDSERYQVQRQKLEAEQIEFIGERIQLKAYRWNGELD